MLLVSICAVQVVYKRYASLYFIAGIDASDNELITLEIVHHFVEVLDRYFGNVCELDLIFNFHKVSIVLFSYSKFDTMLSHSIGSLILVIAGLLHAG